MSISTSWGLLGDSVTGSTGAPPNATGTLQTDANIVAESGSSATDERYVAVAGQGIATGLHPVLGGSHVAVLTPKIMDALVVRAQTYETYTEDGNGTEHPSQTYGSVVLGSAHPTYPWLGTVTIGIDSPTPIYGFTAKSIFALTPDFTDAGTLGPASWSQGIFAQGNPFPAIAVLSSALTSLNGQYIIPAGSIGVIDYDGTQMYEVPSANVQYSGYTAGQAYLVIPAGAWGFSADGDTQVPAVDLHCPIINGLSGAIGSQLQIPPYSFVASTVFGQLPMLSPSVLSKVATTTPGKTGYNVTFVGPINMKVEWILANANAT